MGHLEACAILNKAFRAFSLPLKLNRFCSTCPKPRVPKMNRLPSLSEDHMRKL